MAPEDPDKRLAPINAILNVVSPTILRVVISAIVELHDTDIGTVKESFYADLKSYMPLAKDDHMIRYTKVANILGNINGVYDFKSLTINGSASNIPIELNVTPTLSMDDITVTLGTV